MDLIRSKKPSLIEVLSTDSSFILQHVQSKRLITPREYNSLYSQCQNGEKTIIELLDKLMNKSDEHCHNFISLLGEKEILDNFPRLRVLLSAQQGAPKEEVPQLPATDNPGENSDKIYKMTQSPRGLCIVINNETFKKSPLRKGSSEDKDALENLFKWLDFEVECHDDLTKAEMKSVVQEGSQRADGDCFVCCVLSHGETNGVLGIDEEVLSVEDILIPLKGHNCPKLAGKPKLFFVQACRGKRFQDEVMIDADSTEENQDLDMDAYPGEIRSIPADADFLVSMSTVNDYYSIRHSLTGSWFIQSLCKQLREGVQRGNDILTILTRVNDDVCREEGYIRGKKAKQVPDQTFRLRKQLIFPKPNSAHS